MNISDVWPTLRSILKDYFSFNDIKDLAGRSNLPIHNLAHLSQQFKGGASKGQLLDAIDKIFSSCTHDEKNRVVSHLIADILDRCPNCHEELSELLRRAGWRLEGHQPLPLHLQATLENVELPERVQIALVKSYSRYRDGDYSGSVSAVCGAIDAITEHHFERNPGLGDHRSNPYAQRVKKSFDAREQAFLHDISSTGMTLDRAKTYWPHARKAVEQSGELLARYRQDFADVHGPQNAPPQLVQRTLDAAVFVIRSLA